MRTRMALVVVLVLAVLAGLAGVTPASGASAADAANCTFPHTAEDATGTTVTVDERPERIVVLAPSAAQTVWAIDAQDRVVGMPVDYHTGYLNDTAGIADVVDDQGQPIVESVIAQEPDVVLAPNIIDNDTVGTLRDANLTVYRYHEADSLAAVSAKTRLTGRLIGSCGAADDVANDTDRRVEAVRSANSGDRPLVYYALGGGYTAGPETFVGDVIEAAGGENLAARANISGYASISPEIILEEDPEWIVVAEGTDLRSEALQNTTAMREDQIVRVNRDYLHQAGPRVVHPLERISRALSAERTTAATEGAGPGPSPAAAAVALAAGAGLARRRR